MASKTVSRTRKFGLLLIASLFLLPAFSNLNLAFASTFVQGKISYNVSTTTLSQTFSTNPTGGDLLVAFAQEGGCSNPSAPTDNQGNIWTEAVGPISAPSGGYATEWYATAGFGTETVTITCGSNNLLMLGIVEASGAYGLSTSSSGTCSSGCGTSVTVSSFTAAAGGIVIGFVSTGGFSPTVSAGSGMTLAACYSGSTQPCVDYSTTLSGAGQTAPMNLGSAGKWTELVADFTPGTGPSPPPTNDNKLCDTTHSQAIMTPLNNGYSILPSGACGGYSGDWNIYQTAGHIIYNSLAFGASSNPARSFGIGLSGGNVTTTAIAISSVATSLTCPLSSTCYIAYYYVNNAQPNVEVIDGSRVLLNITPAQMYTSLAAFNAAPTPAAYLNTVNGYVEVSFTYDTNAQNNGDSITFSDPSATTIQPIIANLGVGSTQTITITGCSPSPSTFPGNGSPQNIVMTPNCTFALSLPAGYSFTGGTGTTTCLSGTCNTYTTGYTQTSSTVTQPLSASLSGSGSTASITVNGCSPSPATFPGDGSTNPILMTPNCVFTLTLPAEYMFTGGTGTTSCASGTCNPYSTTYQASPTSVNQPFSASFNNANGGSVQTVTISNSCGPVPATFTGDGGTYISAMTPNCSFSISLPNGYNFIGATTGSTCASGQCNPFVTSYQKTSILVTEQLTLPVANFAPPGGAVGVSGCAATVTTIQMNVAGASQAFNAAANCQITLTSPSVAGQNARYAFTSGLTYTYTTAASGTDALAITVYYQPRDVYVAIPSGSGWDAGLSIAPTGTYLGTASQPICTITPTQFVSTQASCSGYADWQLAVTFPTNPTGATGTSWTAQGTTVFIDSLLGGGNTYSVTYLHTPSIPGTTQNTGCTSAAASIGYTCTFASQVTKSNGIIVTFSSPDTLTSLTVTDTFGNVYQHSTILSTATGTEAVFFTITNSSGTLGVSFSWLPATAQPVTINMYEVTGLSIVSPLQATGSGSVLGTHTTSSSVVFTGNVFAVLSFGQTYGTVAAGASYTLGATTNGYGGAETSNSVASTTNFPYSDTSNGAWQSVGLVFIQAAPLTFSFNIVGSGVFNAPTLICGSSPAITLTNTPTTYLCAQSQVWVVTATLSGQSVSNNERAITPMVTTGTINSQNPINQVFIYYVQFNVFISFQVTPVGTPYSGQPTFFGTGNGTSVQYSMSTAPVGHWLDMQSSFHVTNPFVSGLNSFTPNIAAGIITQTYAITPLLFTYGVAPSCSGTNPATLLEGGCIAPAFVYSYTNLLGPWFIIIIDAVISIALFIKTETILPPIVVTLLMMSVFGYMFQGYIPLFVGFAIGVTLVAVVYDLLREDR